MSTIAALVALQDYLTTSYRPDCEYLEGELLERNVGEWDHSKLQARLIVYFSQLSSTEQIHVVPEQRVQVSRSRFRVPDICVVIGREPQEQILTSPPFLCIEILSRDDRMTEMQERIEDYLRFGVSYVWVLDPRVKRAFAFTGAGVSRPVDQVLETEGPRLAVPLSVLFF
jgi:Uma2 family endonuclease